MPLFPHLQHLVRGGLNAGHHMGGAKRYLLHFCKVVGWVPVENHPSNGDQRELRVGPHLQGERDVACTCIRTPCMH